MKLTKNFSSEELECNCGCKGLPNQATIEKLQALRDAVGFPLKVNSGFRCEEHNRKVGGVSTSQHVQGTAVDLSTEHINGYYKYKLLYEIFKSKYWTGVGIYDTFIHIDCRSAVPVVWTEGTK